MARESAPVSQPLTASFAGSVALPMLDAANVSQSGSGVVQTAPIRGRLAAL
jgi:hypothetical protein